MSINTSLLALSIGAVLATSTVFTPDDLYRLSSAYAKNGGGGGQDDGGHGGCGGTGGTGEDKGGA